MAAEVCAHRLAVFRLAPHGREHVRIRGKPGECRVESRAGDAAMLRLGPQSLQIGDERRARLAARGEAAAKSSEADEARTRTLRRRDALLIRRRPAVCRRASLQITTHHRAHVRAQRVTAYYATSIDDRRLQAVISACRLGKY